MRATPWSVNVALNDAKHLWTHDAAFVVGNQREAVAIIVRAQAVSHAVTGYVTGYAVYPVKYSLSVA